MLQASITKYFIVLIVIESIYLTFYRKKKFYLSDSIASTLLGQCILPLKFLEITTIDLAYVYDNYRIFDFSNSFWSSWTGYIYAVLVVEFWYYLHHRMGHEMNIFWAFHSVHHTSQQYVLATALRQSIWHGYVSCTEDMIMAVLGLPPTQIILHKALNLFYQFWIHTDAVDKLPAPFEFIFNTPSHHRLHHGRNRDCIDCNYGGFLIIYDRIFGTFRPEESYEHCHAIDAKTGQIEKQTNEKISYGLVSNVNTFSIHSIQHDKLIDILKFSVKNILFDPVAVFKKCFYGPGYDGKLRLGDRKNIPNPPKPAEDKIFNPIENFSTFGQIKIYALVFLMMHYMDSVIELLSLDPAVNVFYKQSSIGFKISLIFASVIYIELNTRFLECKFDHKLVISSVLVGIYIWFYTIFGDLKNFYIGLGSLGLYWVI